MDLTDIVTKREAAGGLDREILTRIEAIETAMGAALGIRAMVQLPGKMRFLALCEFEGKWKILYSGVPLTETNPETRARVSLHLGKLIMAAKTELDNLIAMQRDAVAHAEKLINTLRSVK